VLSETALQMLLTLLLGGCTRLALLVGGQHGTDLWLTQKALELLCEELVLWQHATEEVNGGIAQFAFQRLFARSRTASLGDALEALLELAELLLEQLKEGVRKARTVARGSAREASQRRAAASSRDCPRP